mmetsp:Transcript_195/g.429  ORF Transcript_195/g.429 Transcript_195/m.429 type:complete len:221 (+) Transcript_195:1309-1971(+)
MRVHARLLAVQRLQGQLERVLVDCAEVAVDKLHLGPLADADGIEQFLVGDLAALFLRVYVQGLSSPFHQTVHLRFSFLERLFVHFTSVLCIMPLPLGFLNFFFTIDDLVVLLLQLDLQLVNFVQEFACFVLRIAVYPLQTLQAGLSLVRFSCFSFQRLLDRSKLLLQLLDLSSVLFLYFFTGVSVAALCFSLLLFMLCDYSCVLFLQRRLLRPCCSKLFV